MPVRKNLPHLLLPIPGVAEPFQTKGGGGKSPAPSHVPDRESHAQKLLKQLEPIVAAAAEAARRNDLPRDEVGVYVEVVGRAGEPLIAGDGRGRDNDHRERIWFSPACIQTEKQQRSLF